MKRLRPGYFLFVTALVLAGLHRAEMSRRLVLGRRCPAA